MKKYTIEIVIEEGSDEFWEEISHKTGCDDVLVAVREALYLAINAKCKLIKYEDK